MKNSSVVLALTLAANVCLAALFLLREPTSHDDSSVAVSAPVTAPVGGEGAPAISAKDRDSEQTSWRRFKGGEDLARLVARMRAAGYPAAVVRGMIHALVAERFDAERYRVDAAALNTPYWKMWPNSYLDPVVGPKLRKLQAEQRDLIKQLLGNDSKEGYLASEESKAWMELEMGKIPAEKWDRLTAYVAAHREEILKIHSGRGNTPLIAADREKLAALDRKLRNGLSEFLTPEEAYEYNVRNSSAADVLKRMLGPARASEADYRAVFPLYQSYLDQFPDAAVDNAATPASPAQAMAKESLMAQLTAALGPQRAEEFAVALEPKYVALNRLVSRLELPLSTSKQIFNVQETVQQRADMIRNNGAVSVEERAKQLNTLAADASSQLSKVLGGAENYSAYAENFGQWLLRLTPPPKT